MFFRSTAMPRNYTRKRERNDETAMETAVKLVAEDGLTLRRSSELTGVPFQTLQRYVKKFKENQNGMEFKPTYKKNVFDDEMEGAMVEYLTMCSKLNYGLTMIDARELAYSLAKANEFDVPANWHRDEKAGKDWIGSFINRNNLSLR